MILSNFEFKIDMSALQKTDIHGLMAATRHVHPVRRTLHRSAQDLLHLYTNLWNVEKTLKKYQKTVKKLQD